MTKSTKIRITTFLALALPAATLGAEAAQPDAAEFSKGIFAKKKEFNRAGRNFGVKLGTALKSGNLDDNAAMKVAYVDGMILLAKTEDEWQAIEPPSGKAGKDLHAAFRVFIQFQRLTMQKEGLHLIRIVESKDWSAEEKKERGIRIIKSMEQAEKAAEATLEKVHKAFREENNIK